MARKNIDKTVAKSAGSKASKSAEVVSTSAVRHTAVPRPAAAASKVSHAQIARRAFELYQSGAPGTELDHWLQAERELLSDLRI